jgi:hypothetical protein
LKRLRIKKVYSTDGEVHYVVDESGFKRVGNIEYFDENKIKNTTKLEASKPLFLIRGAE